MSNFSIERYVDWGTIVGIVGNDTRNAVAEVSFAGFSPEEFVPIPVRDMGSLGQLTVGANVRAEISSSEPRNPKVLEVSYITDEEIDEF